MKKLLIDTSIRFPRTVMAVTVVLMLGAAALLPKIQVDTDPENMLPADQVARVFHNDTKRDFTLWDVLVVGVLNEDDPDGVFNPQSLARVHQLTRAIEKIDGVVQQDLMSLSTVDNITQGGPGVVRFEWMMDEPPTTREKALEIRAAAQRIPTIEGTLVSEDGKLVAIYVPIIEKSEGHRIASAIETVVAGFEGDEKYFITGLPVAEDTFGVEMFRQMGIAAPLAGLIIFLLMFIFFRSLSLITAPMIVAIVTVVVTMGLLIGFGFTVHIMSSMIPIFLMPIAVVDSIHILSEFADLYPRHKDRKKTIRYVMNDLFSPMFFTSLTSAAGFASLALAPIPPVRVFGLFVAFGITLAFYLTILFIPAYVVRLSDKRIAKLQRQDHAEGSGILARMLTGLGPRTLAGSKAIMAVTAVVLAVSAFGISKIQINDNPVRWFRPSHSIRVADRILNEHFAGTYNAFLVLQRTGEPIDRNDIHNRIAELLTSGAGSRDGDHFARWDAIRQTAESRPASDFLVTLIDGAADAVDDAATDDEAYLWEDVLAELETAQTEAKYFQSPEALAYMEAMQRSLVEECALVGKTSTIADIVKTVHRDLREGDKAYYSIPATSSGVAQTLLSYQSSHRPNDLWHFVTPDMREALVWVQLKSGDNQDMASVSEFVDEYIQRNPLPDGVEFGWAGLTYLNVVWQEKMVDGMLNALLGSFVIVFLMMLLLFRRFWFALLAMLPLTVTIALIYGLIGLVGKDYDMPVAVLSSLTLGLSIDFAIHFLQRSRVFYNETGDWRKAAKMMFEEPARAITRNAIVISVGFLPLLASPLVPYNTVGLFLAAIMILSAAVTLMLLPAVMRHLRGRLFGKDVSDKPDNDAGVKGGGAVKKPTANVVASLSIGIAFAVTMSGVVRAEEVVPAVGDIINRANLASYYAGEDGRAEVRMTIADAQGRERRRQFTILRKDREDGGDQDYAVLFSPCSSSRSTWTATTTAGSIYPGSTSSSVSPPVTSARVLSDQIFFTKMCRAVASMKIPTS
jgi:predicted RND superfamily exporter protein